LEHHVERRGIVEQNRVTLFVREEMRRPPLPP
jgi:hypothetical protein